MLPKKYRLILPLKNPVLLKKSRGCYFSLYVYSSGDDREYVRFAFIVSKKIDKRAVRRNRTKRLLSEAVRNLLFKIKGGFDIVIVARRILCKEDIKNVKEEMEEKMLEYINCN